ncbi:MAG: Cys-tRNA(Pro) deacylase [Clostridia bacterium]|nr:Cys-tRNA(Pro) deacylase [Clostridia bacterium]
MAVKEKTNAIRLLDQKKISYRLHDYTDSGAVAGMEVATILGEDPHTVFKTLVTVGAGGKNYVFIVPVCGELDLKKAARIAGEKWVEMIRARELLPLTGYIHGGCSPIGMKKLFPTWIDDSARACDTICVSGGRVGYQVQLTPADLARAVPYTFADLLLERQ